MASVLVKYNFGSFRVKVAPNDVLNDVLIESLKHYKLHDDKANSSSQNWVLLHNKKPVTLDLPWRLLNLSTGVNLELKKNEPSQSDESVNSRSVKIKLQVSGHQTVIETIKSSADLKDVLDILASKHGWSIDSPEAKLQVFSKVLQYQELRGLTLDDLGIKDSALLRIVLPASPVQHDDVDKSNNMNKDSKTEETADQVEPVIKRHELHKVSVFVPSEDTIVSQIKKDDELSDDYDLTVEQARRYQNMLSKQTGNLGGPLLSRRLRQERENQISKKSEVAECLVRVRFPDLTHIEIAFQPDETMGAVYRIVSDSLIDEELNFTLSQTHPYETFPPDERKLLQDLKFGPKILLVFDSRGKGPYLKSSVLDHAKCLVEADDVKLDRSRSSLDESSDGKGKIASSYNSTTKAVLSEPKIKKVPKWLKLSKK